MPGKAAVWDEIVAEHGLRAPDLMSFVGDSFVYADLHFGLGREHAAPPNMMSTIKLRQACRNLIVDIMLGGAACSRPSPKWRSA